MFDIVSVTLENFKSFKGKHQFTFPTEPGLYYLTGENKVNPRLGANDCGKSTLLDAIFWCLFGRTSRGLKAGEVVTWGEKRAIVTLALRVGRGEYKVRRAQNPNALTVLHETNGMGVHRDMPVEQDVINDLLRLTPEQFSYAVMLPQFGESFFDLAPANKLALFSQIMELDYWLDASATAGVKLSSLKEQAAYLDTRFSKLSGQLEVILSDINDMTLQEKEFEDNKSERLGKLRAAEKTSLQELRQIELALADAEKALTNANKRLEASPKRAPEVCPTCKQEIVSEDARKDRISLIKNQRDFESLVSSHKYRLDMVNRSIKDTGTKVKEIKAEVNQFGEIVKEKRATKLELLNKLEENKQERAALDEQSEAVGFWVNGFKRVRLFVVEETLRQLEIEVNNNLASLGLTDWAITFDVERENKSGGITKGFVVLIHAPNRSEPVRWEAWGGGVTQRLRLAGDLGLANLIMERAGLKGEIEFYDEPSEHVSSEGLHDLCETLHQRALAANKKVWIVDHHAMDFGDFQNILTAVKDEQGSHLHLRK